MIWEFEAPYRLDMNIESEARVEGHFKYTGRPGQYTYKKPSAEKATPLYAFDTKNK